MSKDPSTDEKATISSRFRRAMGFSRRRTGDDMTGGRLVDAGSGSGIVAADTSRRSRHRYDRDAAAADTRTDTRTHSSRTGHSRTHSSRRTRAAAAAAADGDATGDYRPSAARRVADDRLKKDRERDSGRSHRRHRHAADATEDASDSERLEVVWTQETISDKLGLDHIPSYRSDEKGYIHFEKGLLVKDQYVLMETLGRGTFSKVFEAINLSDGRKYALKVIRNSHRYIEAAKTELRVLEHITTTDTGRSCCIHLKQNFSWNKHPCFVFKLYGPSIYAVMSKNHYRPFPPNIVRDLNVQICSAIQFMHNLGIIFTDLKPENIVFCDGRTKPVLISGKTNYLPIDTRVKVVDFGSAVYEPVYDAENRATWRFRHGYNYLIQTRHYRAPEVVLEMSWKRAVDIWSIGCVMLEFIYGSMVFNTHCPIDHLNQMQNMIGEIPHRLIEQSSERKLYELFHTDTYTLKIESAKRSRAQARRLSSYFNFDIAEYKDLYDLAKRMLQWFSEDRIDADSIMRHSYWAASDPRMKARASAVAASGAAAASGRAHYH